MKNQKLVTLKSSYSHKLAAKALRHWACNLKSHQNQTKYIANILVSLGQKLAVKATAFRLNLALRITKSKMCLTGRKKKSHLITSFSHNLTTKGASMTSFLSAKWDRYRTQTSQDLLRIKAYSSPLSSSKYSVEGQTCILKAALWTKRSSLRGL